MTRGKRDDGKFELRRSYDDEGNRVRTPEGAQVLETTVVGASPVRATLDARRVVASVGKARLIRMDAARPHGKAYSDEAYAVKIYFKE